MLSQPGLRWEMNKCFEAEPTWTHDPKVKTIIKLSRKHLQLSDDEKCTADYYSQGAFNRIYLIRCPRDEANERSFIFRASLPVDPGFKVSSDVATMEFMRDHTDAPVPRVLAFDASHENRLGFAWTIMEMMPGRSLCEQWRFMTRSQKKDFVKRIAEIWAQIFRLKFRGIGNIYQKTNAASDISPEKESSQTSHHSSDDSKETVGEITPTLRSSMTENLTSVQYSVGRIVSMSFLWDERVNYDVYRGPFASSFDWLTARLTFVIIESDAVLASTDTHQQRKASASRYSSNAKRLQQQLPNFFPQTDVSEGEEKSEVTILHHYDTSGYNVMADEQGKLTAVLDWDGVSTVPLWKACQMPEFLMSRYIDEMEDYERYGAVDEEGVHSQKLKAEAISLEKEELRTFFLKEMGRMEPQWVQVYQSSTRLGDFEKAVQLCDSFSKADMVDEWVRHLEHGEEYWGLQERLLAG